LNKPPQTQKPSRAFPAPFFDRFAHDLSTLTCTLVASHDLIEENHLKDLPAPAVSTWKKLSLSAAKLRGLVQKFNLYGIALSHDGPETRVSIEQVIEDAKVQSRKLVEKRQATIVTKNLPSILGNRKLLQIAFHEILENALHYSDRDPVRIAISSWTNEQGQIIEFCDHGSGKALRIADSHVAFEPFQRWGDEANPDGSGLGLYIAKEIVEKHQGVISWHIDPDRGTCFWMCIPKSRLVGD